MKYRLQWAGRVETLVPTEKNGPRIEVKPGDVVEVEKEVADSLVKSYPFEFVGMVNKTDKEIEARRKEILSTNKAHQDRLEATQAQKDEKNSAHQAEVKKREDAIEGERKKKEREAKEHEAKKKAREAKAKKEAKAPKADA